MTESNEMDTAKEAPLKKLNHFIIICVVVLSFLIAVGIIFPQLGIAGDLFVTLIFSVIFIGLYSLARMKPKKTVVSRSKSTESSGDVLRPLTKKCSCGFTVMASARSCPNCGRRFY